jgi:hypothetical protein
LLVARAVFRGMRALGQGSRIIGKQRSAVKRVLALLPVILLHALIEYLPR